MGKGEGCFPSTSRKHPAVEGSAPAEANAAEVEVVKADAATGPESVSNFTNCRFYSMYGHVEAMAKKIKEGVENVEGVEGYLFRVAETLPADVLQKMHAPPKDESIPIISASDLPGADAILFGFPTRYGTMPAQMKAFFDSTDEIWESQQLTGKPGGFFVSTGTQGGGQETTAWTAITQLVHHGMLFIPVGYTFGASMFKLDEVKAGSPYGAGTFAGDGTKLPTEIELAFAEHQGRYTAGIVKRLCTS
ncbi:hypothetical protein O6H91_21G063600 [Diphasiastrum complanatum]|uniref:Uncharacterized protein n=1 Tax=Diphasiastrum complanatum TaxID=34168 RepID=A0ACC2ALI9_DIPCM|nr:hypothetical protein O6H91_21G063600 [Diphasiastrum complanatum]